MEILTSHSKLKHGFRVKGEMLYVELGSVPIDSAILKELQKDSEFKTLIKEKKFIVGNDPNSKNAAKAGKIIEEAENDALEIMQKAEDKAAKLEADAQAKLDKATEDAAQIVADAEVKAADIKAKAQAKADKIAPKEA